MFSDVFPTDGRNMDDIPQMSFCSLFLFTEAPAVHALIINPFSSHFFCYLSVKLLFLYIYIHREHNGGFVVSTIASHFQAWGLIPVSAPCVQSLHVHSML